MHIYVCSYTCILSAAGHALASVEGVVDALVHASLYGYKADTASANGSNSQVCTTSRAREWARAEARTRARERFFGRWTEFGRATQEVGLTGCKGGMRTRSRSRTRMLRQRQGAFGQMRRRTTPRMSRSATGHCLRSCCWHRRTRASCLPTPSTLYILTWNLVSL